MASYGITNRCTGGTPYADQNLAGHEINLAFDNNASTYWQAGNAAMPKTIRYDFGAGVLWRIGKLTIKSVLNYGMAAFTAHGSLDNASYTQLYSGTAANNADVQIFVFDNSVKYRYIKVMVVSTYGAGGECMASEIQTFEILSAKGGFSGFGPYII